MGKIKSFLSAFFCAWILTCLLWAGVSHSATLNFSGKTWYVKSGAALGPGPNNWSDQNAWVDATGNLHLKITNESGVWNCAEVWTEEAFGFGTYKWFVKGRIDRLDKNVVLGMFNYGDTDGIDEIDIELAKWGLKSNRIGNYTVYPAQSGLKNMTYPFAVSLNGTASTHRFKWSSNNVTLQSYRGWSTDRRYMIAQKVYSPSLFAMYIPQNPLPVHINLWLFEGQAPANGKEVEVVIKKFTFSSN